jgi:hypothetical protein
MSKRSLILSTVIATMAIITAASNSGSATPISGAVVAIDNAVANNVLETVQWARQWWLSYHYYGGPSYPPAGTYCARRYRSYDPVTSTFIGPDGLRHFCP